MSEQFKTDERVIKLVKRTIKVQPANSNEIIDVLIYYKTNLIRDEIMRNGQSRNELMSCAPDLNANC